MTWATLGLVLILSPIGDPAAPPDTVTKIGRVLLLSDALKTKGIAADPDPIAKLVVLVEPDGSITPLIPDDASRALFLDERLRDRKAQIIVRRLAGLSFLQVVSFKVEEGGAFRTPEYYCDVCRIAVRSPQTCPCCQGPMDLRMRPEIR